MAAPVDELGADVVVLGGGACGMMAALRAACNPNLKVVVFEKSVRQGCNTQFSSGSLAAGGTRLQRAAGVVDSPERHAAEILAVSADESWSDVVHAVCRAAPEYVDWLADEVDYPMELGTDMPRAGQSVPRLHTDIGRLGGARLVQWLRKCIDTSGNIFFVDHTPGTSLLREGTGQRERVTGAVVAEPTGPLEVIADHVVLATDGFANDSELLARHCPDAVGFFYAGASTSTGDGIRLGLQVGGAVRNMTAYAGHGMVVASTGTRLNPNLPFLGAVIVGEDGRRICDETAQGYSKLAGIVGSQRHARAVMIWDEPAMATASHSELMRESEAAGAFRRFDSLHSLAASLDVPVDPLGETLANFEAMSDLVDRPRRRLEPPLFGAWISPGILTTQGGLVVDTQGQVLRPDGSVVVGLSAGGGAACGVSGTSPDGYSSGNGLLAAMGLGWIIGNRLALSK